MARPHDFDINITPSPLSTSRCTGYVNKLNNQLTIIADFSENDPKTKLCTIFVKNVFVDLFAIFSFRIFQKHRLRPRLNETRYVWNLYETGADKPCFYTGPGRSAPDRLSYPVPGDFRSWESPQTLPALFIGLFEYVERFRNLKFAVIRITNIQSSVPSPSEGTASIHLAFK